MTQLCQSNLVDRFLKQPQLYFFNWNNPIFSGSNEILIFLDYSKND